MVVRNIQIKLDVSVDDHPVLDETFEQFRYAAQHVADYGWIPLRGGLPWWRRYSQTRRL